MPDNTNNQGPANITVNKISANRQDVADMQVQRLNVATGEEKTGETDLLAEVRSAIDSQTNTLSGILSNISNHTMNQTAVSNTAENTATGIQESLMVLIRTIGEMNGGGDENNRTGGAGSLGDTYTNTQMAHSASKYLEQMYQIPNDIRKVEKRIAEIKANTTQTETEESNKAALELDQLTRELQSLQNKVGEVKITFGSLLTSGIRQQVEGNILDAISGIQRFVKSLANFSNVTNEMNRKFTSGTSIAASGVANLATVLTDFVPALVHGRDNLIDTFSLVRKSLEANLISPVGTMGSNLAEVGKNLRTARISLRDKGGVTAFDRMNYNTANETMANLFDLQRRTSVSAQLNDISTLRAMGQQVKLAQLIASNTGRTADEVIKANQADATQVSDIAAVGGLAKQDATVFITAMQLLKGRGQNTTAELVKEIAMSGGSLSAFYTKNPEKAQDLAITGQMGTVEQLLNVIRSGHGVSAIDQGNRLMAVTKQFGNNPFTGVAGAMNISQWMQSLAGEAGRSGKYVPVKADKLQAGVQKLTDALNNILPGGELKLVAALGWNTAAVIANTLSRVGLFGRFGKKMGWFGKKMGWLGRLLGIGGAAVAGGAVVEGAAVGSGAAAGTAVASTSSKVRAAVNNGLQKAGKGVGKVIGKSGKAIGKGIEVAGKGAAGIGTGAKIVGAGAKLGMGATLRSLPIIGALAGLGYGGYKLFKGDYVGAGLSAGAGVSGLVPGWGTAGSLALSGILAAHEAGVLDTSTTQQPVLNPSLPPSLNSVLTPRILEDQNTPLVGPSGVQSSTKNRGIRTDTQQLLVDLATIMNTLVVQGNEDLDIQKQIAKNTKKSADKVWSSLTGNTPKLVKPQEPATHSQ